jgi:hypothetical protein
VICLGPYTLAQGRGRYSDEKVANRDISLSLARRDRKWSLNDKRIQNPSNTFGIVPLSNFIPTRGFGFVHHSIAILCHEVPNLSITIRNFFIAVGRAAPRHRCPPGTPAAPAAWTCSARASFRRPAPRVHSARRTAAPARLAAEASFGSKPPGWVCGIPVSAQYRAELPGASCAPEWDGTGGARIRRQTRGIVNMRPHP